MRRKEREVSDLAEIAGILDRCDTIRLCLMPVEQGSAPYVVPLSFGYEIVDGSVRLYFHGASEGTKLELMQANPVVSVEADRIIAYEQLAHGITTRYESVVGEGVCTIVDDAREITHGLRLICEHCGFPEYPLEECGNTDHLIVGRVDVRTISGKHNLPA